MPTKVRHLTGPAVVVATETGTNKPRELRSRGRSDATEESPGGSSSGNQRAEERKVEIL